MWVTLINDHPRVAFSLGHPHIWPSHIHKVAIETPWDPQTLLQMGEHWESDRNPTSRTFCPCCRLIPRARSHRAGLRAPPPGPAPSHGTTASLGGWEPCYGASFFFCPSLLLFFLLWELSAEVTRTTWVHCSLHPLWNSLVGKSLLEMRIYNIHPLPGNGGS